MLSDLLETLYVRSSLRAGVLILLQSSSCYHKLMPMFAQGHTTWEGGAYGEQIVSHGQGL